MMDNAVKIFEGNTEQLCVVIFPVFFLFAANGHLFIQIRRSLDC
jgi:hypothetical protein